MACSRESRAINVNSKKILMFIMRRYASLLLVLICLWTNGCSGAKELGKTLGALTQVRAEIIKRFGEEDVNVRVNTFQGHTTLSVTFINSSLNGTNFAERAKRAQETAEIVKLKYGPIKTVNEIWVGFMRVTTHY